MAELLQNLPAAVFFSCDIFSGVQDASQAQEGQESFWICALIGLNFFALSSYWDAYYLSLLVALILWFAPFMKYKYEEGYHWITIKTILDMTEKYLKEQSNPPYKKILGLDSVHSSKIW